MALRRSIVPPLDLLAVAASVSFSVQTAGWLHFGCLHAVGAGGGEVLSSPPYTLHLSTSSHRPLNSVVALLDHASMRTARYIRVVLIVVHIVTTAAAPGSVKQDKAKAGCDCKGASTNSCAEFRVNSRASRINFMTLQRLVAFERPPHSNDDSRCWGVCCSGYNSDPPGV